MELIKPNTNFDFIGKRKLAMALSCVLILTGVVFFFSRGGFNYGVDFAGGTLVQLKFQKDVPIGPVRTTLKKLGFGDSSIQHFGSEKDILIRMERWSEELEDISKVLTKNLGREFADNPVSVERVEMVGPKVGKDLREKAFLSLFYSMVGILIYVAIRFEFKFGFAAIVATFHDVLILATAFLITDKEFTLPIIASFLAIIGYSLNDTIVVFDRIRENMRRVGKKNIPEIINSSVNQTLSRTLLTSGTTLMVVVTLFFYGGEVIHGFTFTLLIGIIVGTYSSIYIASPMLIIWDNLVAKNKAKK